MKFDKEHQIISWRIKEDFSYAQKHLPAADTVGSLKVKFPVSTFTQFDPLKEVIVGYIDYTASRNEDLLQINQAPLFENGNFPSYMVEQGQKNLQRQAQQYQELGVNVLRVGVVDYSEPFEVGGFKTFGFTCFSPRDIPFIYHDSFYEFPSYAISRSTEFQAFEWIQQQLYKKGSKIYSSWISIPDKPNFRYLIPQLKHSFESEKEYFADAANLMKLGLDILFLISMSGSIGCYKKFQSLMNQKYDGKVRVHPVERVYQGTHIDTTISPVGWNKKLGKYLVFANGSRVNPTNIPAIFRGKNWIVIDFTEIQKQFVQIKGQFPLASDCIGMNFMAIDNENICISSRQKKLKECLEFYGINPILVQNKFASHLSGGNHCTTNDTYRQDTHGFGKILSTPTSQLTLEQRAGLFDPQLLRFLESQGGVDDWVQICNKNNIFPTYTYDHLSSQQRVKVEDRHKATIEKYQQQHQSSTEGQNKN